MAISQPPATVAPSAAAASSRPSVRYGFDHATLGESLAAWRGADPRHAQAPCSTTGATVICRAGDQPLGGGYAARDLTYWFVDGRLAKISFRSSIDGFAFVMARLEQRFGPPDHIVRDQILISHAFAWPHVHMTWRNGRSTLFLDDPTPDAVHLEVGMRLDAPGGATNAGHRSAS